MACSIDSTQYLVRSFEDGVLHVDVYEFLAPFRTPDDVLLPFPVLGSEVARRITR